MSLRPLSSLEIKSDVDALGIPGMQNLGVSNNLSGEIELIRSDLIHDQVIEELSQLKISYYSKGRIKDEERFMNSFFEIDLKYVHPEILNQKIDVSIEDKNSCVISYSLGGNRYEQRVPFDQPYRNEHYNMVIKRNLDHNSELSHEDFYVIIHSRNALLNMLSENLEVQILNPSANTLKIIYTDPNPIKSKAIVDCVNKVYLQNTLELKSQASKQTIGFLDDQLRKTEKKLADSEQELEKFVEQNKTTNIKDIYSQSLRKTTELDKEINAVKLKLNLLNRIGRGFSK